MKYIQAFFMSLGMFTCIPCPYRPWNETARRLMLAALPMVGLVIGLIWYGLYSLLDRVSIPLQLQTAALMLYPYLITGLIHLDGFMDTSDALLSRRPLEEKLRILKDPHTGAFAVISAVILLILCYASMSAVVEQIQLKQALDIAKGDPMLALILIPVITRCCSALAVLAGKPLNHSQYKEEPDAKKHFGEAAAVSIMGLTAIIIAIAIGAGLLKNEPTYSVFLAVAGAVITYIAAMLGAVHKLKGVSGDLAGYALTIAEAAAILALALLV